MSKELKNDLLALVGEKENQVAELQADLEALHRVLDLMDEAGDSSSQETEALLSNPAAEYTCVDCGGPRSNGSAERCKKCYQAKAQNNTETRGEAQCPKCGSAGSRKGKSPSGEQRFMCRNAECATSFGANARGDQCGCGRPDNHVGICRARWDKRLGNAVLKWQGVNLRRGRLSVPRISVKQNAE